MKDYGYEAPRVPDGGILRNVKMVLAAADAVDPLRQTLGPDNRVEQAADIQQRFMEIWRLDPAVAFGCANIAIEWITGERRK
jgi:hypothetical protein